MSFTFIHAADLHLDSPFQTVRSENETVANLLHQATFQAFDNLVALALAEKVALVLFAGDIYDAKDRSLRAQLHFRDGLETLARAGIHSFVLHGNHDPLAAASMIQYPSLAHIFPAHQPQTVSVELPGQSVTVTALSYHRERETRNLAGLFTAPTEPGFHIALLHANCGANAGHENYAPCGLDELMVKNFHYWALGHVHERKELHRYPHVVYPGNLQGRSIRETGPRGCYLVTVESPQNISLTFRSLQAVCWYEQNADIDALDSIDQLDTRLAEIMQSGAADAHGCPAILRLTLIGRGPLHNLLRDDELRRQFLERLRRLGEVLQPFVWIEELIDQTRPDADLEARAQLDDLAGLTLRLAEKKISAVQSDPTAAIPPLFHADALGEFWNHPAAKNIAALTPEEILLLMRQARQLCWDLLENPT